MKCLAFVIGISEYKYRKKLNNAVNDASAVVSVLCQLKFEVEALFDCSYAEAHAKWYEIENKLINDKYDAFVFYYAGHGEIINKTDCLLMKNAPLPENNFDIKPKAYCLSVDEIMKDLNGAGGQMNIIILDACRVSHEVMRGTELTNDGTTIGKIPYQTFIAFSTAPGDTAPDGKFGQHSPFAEAFLAHILEEYLDIEMLFKKVRKEIKAKGYSHYPWEHTCLLDKFCFNHGQMSKYYGLPYSENAYKRCKYMADPQSLDADIIDKLSSDEDEQKLALNLLIAEHKNLTSTQIFHIGRLIYNKAVNGSGVCIDFLRKITTIHSLKDGNQNHLLRGIFYEIFFDENDILRQKPLGSSDILSLIEILRERIQDKDSENFVLGYIPNIEKQNGFMLGKTLDHKFYIKISSSDLYDVDWCNIKQIEDIRLFNRSILADVRQNFDNLLVDWMTIRIFLADYYGLPLQKIKIHSSIAKDDSWNNVSLADEIPDIYEFLEDVCRMEHPSEVDMLSTLSYIEEIEDYCVTEIYQEDDKLSVRGTFNVSVHIEFDGESEDNMSFPGLFTIYLTRDANNGWILSQEHQHICIDTERYYH